MKIGHVVESLDPRGCAAALADLAEAAPGAGYEIVVVALAPSDTTGIATRLARAGTPPVELNVAPWDPRGVLRVVAAFRERGVDLVHTHGLRPDVVGSAAAARLRVPAVSTLHHIHEQPADRGDQLRRTAKTLARRRFMTRTIATSVLQRDWYRRVAGSTAGLSVIPDGAADPGVGTPDAAARLRRGLGVDENEVVAVSVAPMRRGQGQHMLLDAVAEIPPDEPLTVVLGGDGPLRPWLESRVAGDDALSGRVAFRRSTDPVELLRAADVQLHTTRHDTMPRMLVLEHGTGTPAVATRVGGIPEIVTRHTGALAPVVSSRIADELVRLTRDPELRARYGAAARQRFLDRFEASGWAAQLGDVYRSALGHADAPAPAELDTPEPVGPAGSGLLNAPSPSISTVTRSPGAIGPTPAGLPVSTTSPGCSVIHRVTQARISGTEKIIFPVSDSCTTRSPSRVRTARGRSAGPSSSPVSIHGSSGRKVSALFALVHWPSDRQSCAVTSLAQVRP